MKTLFLMERYAGGDPSCAESNSHHNFVSSLKRLGISEVDCLFFDDYFRETGDRVDEYLINHYRDIDLLFFTYLFHYHWNPGSEAIKAMRTGGTKVVCMWSDFCKIRSPAYEDAATLNLVIDVPVTHDPRYYSTFTPQDPNVYYDRGFPRDLNVSFVGCGNKPERRNYFSRLHRENGLFHLHETSMARRSMALSPEDYASLFQRSKISLNFSRSENGQKQLKGRIFEILLCGAMLMSDPNEYMDAYFTAGEDYVRFENPEDLVQKCRYYLTHEDERLKIAEKGRKKTLMCYNNEVFWKQLLRKVNL